MFTLRLKFIFALLVTSAVAVLLVGLCARWILLGQFSRHLADRAFEQFSLSAVAYIREHGSLEKAVATEPFGRFERRMHIGHAARANPDDVASRFRPQEPRPLPESAPLPEVLGEEGEEAGMPPGPPGAPQNRFQPPDRDEATQPPFKFLLLDTQERVAMGDDAYPPGTRVPAALRAQARPIVVHGKLAAWAVPLTTPNLTFRDQIYLNALNEALFYAALAAALFTGILGVVIGRGLSADLNQLTQAIQAIGDGELGQQVQVRSSDEVGLLAAAFNRMSGELARVQGELRESTAQIQLQAQRLQELSVRDALTQLYNRRHFDEQAVRMFSQAERYGQPLTLGLADVDHFKRINDRFSHAVGDEVLRRVASLLQSHTRESDLLARYGGEEFVLALPNTSGRDAAAVCEKLRREIESYPWQELHPDLRVTLSIGYSDDRSLGSFEKMLGAADACLYRAKEAGRNRVCADLPLAATTG